MARLKQSLSLCWRYFCSNEIGCSVWGECDETKGRATTTRGGERHGLRDCERESGDGGFSDRILIIGTNEEK